MIKIKKECRTLSILGVALLNNEKQFIKLKLSEGPLIIEEGLYRLYGDLVGTDTNASFKDNKGALCIEARTHIDNGTIYQGYFDLYLIENNIELLKSSAKYETNK